jgi:hypothetical protein
MSEWIMHLNRSSTRIEQDFENVRSFQLLKQRFRPFFIRLLFGHLTQTTTPCHNNPNDIWHEATIIFIVFLQLRPKELPFRFDANVMTDQLLDFRDGLLDLCVIFGPKVPNVDL